MKKLLILITVFLISFSIYANPIMMPPVMSEFYIVTESEWFLEIYIDPLYYESSQEIHNLDGLEIISSNGSSLVKEGIYFTNGDIIILTQDSLQSPVQFNRNSDFIGIENINTGISEVYYFGEIQYSQISALSEGQSLVLRKTTCGGDEDYSYFLCKDASPDIGEGPYTTTNALGLYSGKVFDRNNDPVSGISIGNDYTHFPYVTCGSNSNVAVITDENGYFSFNEYAGNHITKMFFNSTDPTVILDSLINIEPNTDNYYEFNLDTIFTEIKSPKIKTCYNFTAYPNPGNGEISFTCSTSDFSQNNTVLIKLYNTTGEIVKILPVKSYGNESCITYWDGICANRSAASGQYICKLELNGKNVAELKLIITK